MGEFDPYHLWLQIPPAEQPPNHYRLLGLANFESDPDVIDNAADQRMVHLRNAQNGAKGQIAQRLMNEVSQARLTLLDEKRRAAYDDQVREKLESAQARSPSGAPGGFQISDNKSGGQGPQVVTSGASSKTRAYARRKKNSATMTFVVIGGSLIVFVGLIIFLVNNRGKDSEEGKKTADKSKSASATKKTNLNKDSKKPKSRDKDRKKGPSSRQGQKTPVKVPEKDTGKKIPEDKPEGQGNGRISTSPKNPLDSLIARTFSPEYEKSLAVGKPIDMLPMLKFPECLRQGIARNLKSKIDFESIVGYTQVNYPVFLPSHYDLEATVTSRSSESGFGFGIHLANNPCFLMIDGFPDRGHLTGIRQIDDKDIDVVSRTDVASGRLLKEDEPTKLKVSVRPTGVQLLVNGEVKYQWTGDPRKLKVPPHQMPGTANSLFQFWMMSMRARVRVEDVRLIPRGPAAEDSTWLERSMVKDQEELGAPVDILKKFDPTRVKVQPVAKNRFGLAFGPGNRAGTEIPVKLPPEYDVRMTARLAGNEGFAAILPMAGRRVALMMDQYARNSRKKKFQTGLQMVSRQYIGIGSHPGHLPAKIFPVNKDVPLEIKVRYDSVRLYVDGKFVYGWAGSRYRLSAPPWPSYPPNSGKEYLRLASFSNAILIKKLSFRPVTQTNHADIKDVVSNLQSINPSLKDFWTNMEIRQTPSSSVTQNNKQGFSSPKKSTTSNTKKTKVVSTSSNAKAEIDFTSLSIDRARLKWRPFTAVEKDEINQLAAAVSRISQLLESKKWDEANEAIEAANENVELRESKRVLAGISQVARDLKTFWLQMPSRCALLKATQQIEFADTASIVVSASKTELRLRSSGEAKTYLTDELPLGLAMKIFEMTSNSKTQNYYRTRGSVFFIGSGTDPKHLTSALSSWLEAEQSGADIGGFLALLSK